MEAFVTIAGTRESFVAKISSSDGAKNPGSISDITIQVM